MQEIFKGQFLDIAKLKWGEAPVQLLPTALCRLWSEERVPSWVANEAGLPDNATVAALGSQSFWKSASRATPRVTHYVMFLVKSRAKTISSVRCFNHIWPRGLRIAGIPFSVRSTNVLQEMGLLNDPDALMETTFGQLLGTHGLGIKSLVEIVTLVESAIQIHERIAAGFSMSSGTTTAVSPEAAPPQLNQDWKDLLIGALQEPWADQVSEQDPRFGAWLPPGQGTLEERIERLLSDPTTVASNAPLLLGSLPIIHQAVEQLQSKFLEDSLMELLVAAMGDSQPRLNVIAARLGWRGEDPKTLQECGDALGVTRERVRQIEQTALMHLPKHPVLLPKLDLGIDLLEAAAPIPVDQAAQLLADRTVSRRPFSALALLTTAELLGRKTTLSVSNLNGRRVVVSASNERMLGAIVRVARALAGRAGVASVFQVVDKLTELSGAEKRMSTRVRPLTEDDIRRELSEYAGCEFLDQDWFWFTDIREGRNRLENIAKKILSVASPQSISSVREGVRRAFRYRSISTARYRSLTVPPHSVMTCFFQRHPEFRVEGDSVTSVKALDFRNLLGEGELVLVDVIRRSALGVLDRETLIDACVAQGLNENTLSVYTTYSSVIEHIGLDLWKLRGVRVDPAAVESVREQNQLRPREQRLLEHGWTSGGRLWIAWKLPRATGLVLAVPGAVRRYLCNRSFVAIAKNSNRSFGQVSINEGGTSYGYGSFVRYIGADEGDILLTEFNLAKADVELSIADSSVFDEN